ncbi:MAG: VWA domain-containing protein [Planctomycetaceae bacterium]|nr:VWA domain-containing protein [Planctomycetaceae bacterium]
MMSSKVLRLSLFLLLMAVLLGCGESARESARRTAQLMDSTKSAALPMQADSPKDERIPPDFNTESYDHVVDNPFLDVKQNPLSTFSIDVDTAAYSNVRRFLNQGTLPPKGAVRIEEMVNYFDYNYEPPKDEHPFSASVEVAPCPWKEKHQLARIGLKGKVFEKEERPTVNLVFLLDVSGSMNMPNKLPLLKSAMTMLVKELQDRDRVAIVTYAGSSGLVLPPTTCDKKQEILKALDRLQAGGSTAGASGITLAYQTAEENFVPGEVNRVILCTDGDFNVGITNQSDLIDLIEKKAKSGIFLTVLGFGMGNYKDSTLEKLADKGNGNYGYIDTLNEARKMLVNQIEGSLITIAKDVKIQVEFNPAKVGAYRLIGYENRLLRNEDFNDDTKDAGEIGAGHTVTAFYELVSPDEAKNLPGVDPLKYQVPLDTTPGENSDELFTLKLRYKEPDSDVSKLMEIPVPEPGSAKSLSPDCSFAAAVAAFGMILRDSPHKGGASIPLVLELANAGKGADPNGYRAEFVQLAKLSESLLRKN